MVRRAMATIPNFDLETAVRLAGARNVAGVDEVGRGPWAGPVVAAAVILDPQAIPDGLNDSKQLSAKRRADLANQLQDCAQIGIGQASVAEIDDLNILRASHLAMERAVAALPIAPDHVLVDGNQIPRGLNHRCDAVVKGDSISVSIAAASIVAKIWRDRLMVDLAQQHPGYGWDTNAGYGTKLHQDGLRKFGVTPHHRRSFKPIHKILYQEKS